MVKQFLFRQEKKTRRNYGGYNVNATIYQVKNNVPKVIGSTKWQTASFKGEQSEVMDYLIKNKKIPSNCSRDGYYSYDIAKKCKIDIREI